MAASNNPVATNKQVASNKPLVWLPFAAGGMLAALVLPAVMLVGLLDGFGVLSADALSHARVAAFASRPLVALALFAVFTLVLWHAAHRLRMTVQDLGIRGRGARRWLARGCYALASIGTLALGFALASI